MHSIQTRRWYQRNHLHYTNAYEAVSVVRPAHSLGDRQPLNLLPRVSAATRADIVKRIDAIGSQEFTQETIGELERDNPELFLMSHNFAEDHTDYGGVIQGFALLYACLLAEAHQERAALH